MKKLLLRYVVLIGLFCCLIGQKGYGQVNSLFNFENNFNTTAPSTNANAWTNTTGFVFTPPAIAGSFSLTPSSTISGAMRNQYLLGSGITLLNNDFTWRILYRAGTNGASNTFTAPIAGNNVWRLWLVADGTTTSVCNGMYLTHQGGNLILKRVKTNGTGVMNVFSIAISNTTTYSIKVTRKKDGTWAMFVTAGTGEPTNAATGSYGDGGSDLPTTVLSSSSIYTILEESNTYANSFIWDNYQISKPYLNVLCNSNSVITSSTVMYPGSIPYTLFSFQLTAVEDIPLAYIHIGLNADVSLAFQSSSFRIWRSTDNTFNSAVDVDITGTFGAVNLGVGTGVNGYIEFTNGTIANGSNFYYFIVGTTKPTYASNPSAVTLNLDPTTAWHGNAGGSFVAAANTSFSANAFTCSNGPLNFGTYFDWTGNNGSVFLQSNNWSTNVAPGVNDIARIGVNTGIGVVTEPVLNVSGGANTTIGGLIFGTKPLNTSPTNYPELSLTVNTPLIVNGAIVQNCNYNIAANNIFLTTITGSAAINANSLRVGNSADVNGTATINGAAAAAALVWTNTSSASVIDGDITIYGSQPSSTTNYSQAGPATFILLKGKVTCDRLVISNQSNAYGSFALDLSSSALAVGVLATPGAGTLKLVGDGITTAPFVFTGSGTSQVLLTTNPSNTNTAIEYGSSAAVGQTVFTKANLPGSTNNTANDGLYDNIVFSGTSTKTVQAGALSVNGNFTTTETPTVDMTVNNPTTTITGALINGTGATIKQGGNSMTVSGAFTNSGTFTGGSGVLNLSSTYTNNAGGAFTAGAGAVTVSGITTLNAGAITSGTNTFSTVGFDVYGGTFQAGTGNFTNTAFTRLNAGAGTVTFGSGTTTLGNALQLNGGTVNFGTGAATITPNLAMSPTTGGVINCSTGSVSIANGLTISSGTFNGPSGVGTLNVSGAFTNSNTYAPSNPGTFTPGTGTVTFNGSYTNSSTFNYSIGTINFNNALTGAPQSVTDNSTTGTLFNNVNFTGANATNGPINLSTSASGKFTVSSTGVLTLKNGTTKVTTGGVLTLRSDGGGTGSVAQIPSGSSITGTATIERWFTASRGWRLMSYPVNNTTTIPVTTAATSIFTSLKNSVLVTGPGGAGSGFTASAPNGATILIYQPVSDNYTVLSNISNPIFAGTGFYFFFRGDNTNVAGKTVRSGGIFATPESNVKGLLTGTLNQQGFSSALTTTGKGYNFLGNPYPSSILLTSSAFSTLTSGISVLNAGGASIIPASLPYTLSSGQGFIVKTTAAKTINFTEGMKTPTATPGLFAVADALEPGNITLQMTQDSANYDLTLLRFGNSFKKTYDEGEDIDDLNAPAQTVFLGAITSDNHLVGLNSLPLDKKSTSVYLNVDDNASGLYSIKRKDLSNIPAAYDVWLMDHFKKDSLDLRIHDNYNFNIDKANAATFGSSRFEVVIRKKQLPPYKLLSFVGNKSSFGVLLDWNTINEYDFTSFELQKSTDGKSFESIQNMQSASLGSYSYKDINLSKSNVYYRLKQTDINDNITYSNIVIISNQSSNGSTFSIYPNPAANFIQYTLNQNASSQMRLSIFNSVGKLMKSGLFNTPSGQQDVSSLMPGTYTIDLVDINSKKVLISGKFIKL